MEDSTYHTRPRPLPMALAAVFLAYFASFFVMGKMSNALPRIAAELDGMLFYSWAIAIPFLVSAFSTLIFSKLSDLFGRRIMMLASVSLMLLGAVLSATAFTFSWLIVSLSILSLGMGAIQPLCFSVLGDLFAPVERSRWAGLLNIASGVSALVAPTLGGWVVDNLYWSLIFWIDVPVILLSGIFIFLGLPARNHRQSHHIDLPGSLLLAVASTSMIIGLSWAGSTHPWISFPVLGLLGLSLASWLVFLRIESKAEEPMLDPRLLTNRTFLVASLAALLSTFGFTAMLSYYPLFLQGVQGTSASLSGKIITPFSVIMSFMGIPAGFLLARTRRYKWMLVTGYSILTLVMGGMVALKAEASPFWGVIITTLAGVGLGAIPTINALIVQYAVPRKSIGVAMGGLYFFVAMGKAIGPAILGSVLNAVYARQLAVNLEPELVSQLTPATVNLIRDPRLLLSVSARLTMQQEFNALGNQGLVLMQNVLDSVRLSLESGLRGTFLVGAVSMLIALLLILTIPVINLEDQQ